MEIIPAIYILNGKCVALYKSSYEQKQTYFKTPLNMASHFKFEGAEKLYLVDLDGKKNNTFQQKETVAEIARVTGLKIFIEAGFNTLQDIRDAFDLGVSYVVVRPVATHLIKEAVKKFGTEKIFVLIQAKGDEIIDGIQKNHHQEIDVVDYAESLVPMGVKNVVYKDERSEGTLIHPNYDEVDRLVLITGSDLNIYVAGGISEEKHLQLLKKIGADGAIIGKAFYEKILTIADAKVAVS